MQRKPPDGVQSQDSHCYDPADVGYNWPAYNGDTPTFTLSQNVPLDHPHAADTTFRYFSVYNEDHEKEGTEKAILGIAQVDNLPLETSGLATLSS